MSEQDGTQSSTKQRRSRKVNTTNQENSKQAPAGQHPANDDTEAWKSYWRAQGQPWRTEPEITTERQKYLAERRSIMPNIKQGIYPFKDVKLNRADVEWLLATHENGRGPVDWNDKEQRGRHGLDLCGAVLTQEDLHGLPLARLCSFYDHDTEYQIEYIQASQEVRKMTAIHLEGANLSSAHLEGARLSYSYLAKTEFFKAHLQRANLYKVHLEGAYLSEAHLEGTSLRGAFFDAATSLTNIMLDNEEYGGAFLAGTHWNEADLTVVNWAQVKKLGDEHEAKQPTMWYGRVKNTSDWHKGYRMAVQANRQLAIALQNQGLYEDASRFAYQSQLMQRKAFWYHRKFGQYLFSLFLALLTGYGYKPLRCFITYVGVISFFATIYFLLSPHLAWNEAIVISMTAFHGRGFFPDQFHPGDPQALVAALEAFVGLLIEVTFIATLTQRLFGR